MTAIVGETYRSDTSSATTVEVERLPGVVVIYVSTTVENLHEDILALDDKRERSDADPPPAWPRPPPSYVPAGRSRDRPRQRQSTYG